MAEPANESPAALDVLGIENDASAMEPTAAEVVDETDAAKAEPVAAEVPDPRTVPFHPGGRTSFYGLDQFYGYARPIEKQYGTKQERVQRLELLGNLALRKRPEVDGDAAALSLGMIHGKDLTDEQKGTLGRLYIETVAPGFEEFPLNYADAEGFLPGQEELAKIETKEQAYQLAWDYFESGFNKAYDDELAAQREREMENDFYDRLRSLNISDEELQRYEDGMRKEQQKEGAGWTPEDVRRAMRAKEATTFNKVAIFDKETAARALDLLGDRPFAKKLYTGWYARASYEYARQRYGVSEDERWLWGLMPNYGAAFNNFGDRLARVFYSAAQEVQRFRIDYEPTRQRFTYGGAYAGGSGGGGLRVTYDDADTPVARFAAELEQIREGAEEAARQGSASWVDRNVSGGLMATAGDSVAYMSRYAAVFSVISGIKRREKEALTKGLSGKAASDYGLLHGTADVVPEFTANAVGGGLMGQFFKRSLSAPAGAVNRWVAKSGVRRTAAHGLAEFTGETVLEPLEGHWLHWVADAAQGLPDQFKANYDAGGEIASYFTTAQGVHVGLYTGILSLLGGKGHAHAAAQYRAGQKAFEAQGVDAETFHSIVNEKDAKKRAKLTAAAFAEASKRAAARPLRDRVADWLADVPGDVQLNRFMDHLRKSGGLEGFAPVTGQDGKKTGMFYLPARTLEESDVANPENPDVSSAGRRGVDLLPEGVRFEEGTGRAMADANVAADYLAGIVTRSAGAQVREALDMEAIALMVQQGHIDRVEPSEIDGQWRVYYSEQELDAQKEAEAAKNPKAATTGKGANKKPAGQGGEKTGGKSAAMPREYRLMSREELEAHLLAQYDLNFGRTVAAHQLMMAVESGAAALQDMPGWVLEEMEGLETEESLKAAAAQADAAIKALEAIRGVQMGTRERAQSTRRSLSETLQKEAGYSRDKAEESLSGMSSVLTVGEIETTRHGASARAEVAREKGETGEKTAFASAAYVVRRRDAAGNVTRILRYARDEVDVKELYEEVMEDAAMLWCETNNINERAFHAQLEELQRLVNEAYREQGRSGPQFIAPLKDGATDAEVRQRVIEALSDIGNGTLMSDYANGAKSVAGLPAWVGKLLRFLGNFLRAHMSMVRLGNAVRKIEKTHGAWWKDARLGEVIRSMHEGVEALYRAEGADVVGSTLRRWEAEAEGRAVKDAAIGRGESILEEPPTGGGTAEAHFSLAIPAADICRTRQEARVKVGRKGEPLKLENRFLKLEAVFNSLGEGKFSHQDSLGRSIHFLTAEGYSEEDAKTAHWTAYGNVKDLFANGERMEFERAYKKKESRKGFLHVYSPFEVQDLSGAFEADIELMIHQEAGKLPTAYLLSVSIQKRHQAVLKSMNKTPIDSDVPDTAAIQSDFPEFVKPQAQAESEAHYSVIGEHAATWDKYRWRAFTGLADGKPRAELDASRAQLFEDGVRAARKEAVPLGKFIDFPELFAAYPQLADLPVRFSEALGREAAGSLSMSPDSGERVIVLNAALKPEAVLPELLHEVQHAIQGIEGFAPGGTLLDAYDVYARGLNDRISSFNAQLPPGAALPFLSSDIKDAPGGLTAILEALANVGGPEAVAMRDEVLSVGSRLADIYRDFAGEREARAVAGRVGMTAKEREAWPFEGDRETEAHFSQRGESLEEVTAAWRDSLARYERGELASREMKQIDLRVGPTPAVLQMIGAKGVDLVMTPAVLDKATVGKHAVSLSELAKLPMALHEPICVAQSDTRDSVELITVLKEGGHNILVAVNLDTRSHRSRAIKVNRITSLYGKENIKALLGHPMLYWDKAKARVWTGERRLQLPGRPYPKAGYKGTILKPADLVKWKEKNGWNESAFSVRAMDASGDVLEAGVFLARPDGNPNWFVLPARKGRAAMPVRLLVGEDTDFHRGYGLTHIAASRDEEGLWKRTSPARYLADILANVSELWEVVPGREILVKGKTPSSWMVLQLDSAEGYYSIVTAYPMRGRQKPKGKKLPLAERSIARGQQPANPDAEPGAFGALKNGAASSGSFAGGEGAPSLPQGARVVNINEVQLRFDDGRAMDAFYSVRDAGAELGTLSLIDYATGRLAMGRDAAFEKYTERVRGGLKRAADRLSFGDFTKESGLSAMSQALAVLDEVERALPGNYGYGLEAYKTWAKFFITLYSTGEVDEAAATLPMSGWPEVMRASIGRQVEEYLAAHPEATAAEFLKGYGQKRTLKLIGKFLDRALTQYELYLKDVELGRMRRVASRVAPRHASNGKPLKGKMSADGYRKLEDLLALTGMTQGQWEAVQDDWVRSQEEAGVEHADWSKIDPSTPLKVDSYDGEGNPVTLHVTALEFNVYACWERMTLEQARGCAAAVGEFIETERHAWQNAEDRRRAALAEFAEKIHAAVGEVDRNRWAKTRNEAQLKKFMGTKFLDSFMNAPQFFDLLASVPGVKDLANAMLAQLELGLVKVENSQKNRRKFLHETVAGIIGSGANYDVAEFLYAMKQEHEVKVTGEDGEERTLTIQEREPDWTKKPRRDYRDGLLKLLRRKARMHGHDAAAGLVRRLKVSEGLKKELEMLYPPAGARDVKLESMLTEQEAARYADEEGYVRRRAEKARNESKWAQEGYSPEPVEVTMSRDAAAYHVLLYEQDDYQEMLERKGFTPDVIDALRAYAGPDMMRLAYAMREYVGRSSDAMRQVVEGRYGCPFAPVKNYFRAYFDVDVQEQERAIAEGAGYGDAQGNARFGSIYARHRHEADTDRLMGATTAFEASMREQDVFLHLSEVPRTIRAVLNFRDRKAGVDTRKELHELLGAGGMERLRLWTDQAEKTGVEYIRGHLELNKALAAFSSASAVVVLSGRMGTIMKQYTAILNGMHCCDAVDAGAYFASMGRVTRGKGMMSVEAMMRQEEIASRGQSEFLELAAALSAPMNAQIDKYGRLSRDGMRLMDRADVYCNAVSSAIVYDAVYRDLQAKQPEAAHEALHAAAMAQVRHALAQKSQPNNHLSRSLIAQNKLWLAIGPLWLAGEGINTAGNVVKLFRQGKPGRALQVWLMHGAMMSLLQAALDWMTDDEEKRRKRSMMGYVAQIILGPLQGVPIVSTTFGAGLAWTVNLGLNALGSDKQMMYGNKSMVPYFDFGELHRKISRGVKVFTSSKYAWQEKVMAADEVIRCACIALIASTPMNTKSRAAAAGMAASVGAVTNLLDFLLKTERAAEERLF